MTANEMIGEWPVWGRRFRNSNVAWQSGAVARPVAVINSPWPGLGFPRWR